jgi:hypothetical protein
MLLPSHDQPWRLKADKAPTFLKSEMSDPQTGQPLTAEQLTELAQKRVDTLSAEIRDQLAACKFTESGRRMIQDACRIGAGLLIGPLNVKRVKRKRTESQDPTSNITQIGIEIEETVEPEVEWGDPWLFYPEPVNKIDKATYADYLFLMSDADLRRFGLDPRVDQEELKALLDEEPQLGEVVNSLKYRNQYSGYIEPFDSRYAVWRHTGSLKASEIKALGIEAPDDGKPLPMAEIWYCQGRVLLTKLRQIDGDFRIPYYVFSPFPADDTPFGYSIPYLSRDSQRVADAAWQMALRNGAVSSGPMTFLRAGKVKPADDTFEIRGPKLFYVDDDGQRMDDLVHVEIIPNNVSQALGFLDRALQLMDGEINMPQFTNPDVNKAAMTSSGMAMWLNAVTIVQRRAAAAFDDNVISPMIERMVWWNQTFSTKPELQVDVRVEALGQSELLVKDLQVQNDQVFLGLVSKPEFSPYVDFYQMLVRMARRMDQPGEIILQKDVAEKKAAEAQQGAQQLEGAKVQAELARASAENARAQAEQARTARELQAAQTAENQRQEDNAFRVQDRMLDHQEKMAKIEVEKETTEATLYGKRLEVNVAAAQLASKEKIALAQVNADMGLAQIDATISQFVEGYKGRMQAEKIAQGYREMALKVSPQNPSHQGI